MVQEFKKVLATLNDPNKRGTEIKRSDENERYPHKHKSQWLLLDIFVHKVFEVNFNIRYQGVKHLKKNKGTFSLSTFKTDITKLPLFLKIFFPFWSLKLIIVLNTFWTKISKSSHCGIDRKTPGQSMYFVTNLMLL